MAVQICLCALCVLTTALFIFTRVTKGGAMGILTKALASFGFVLYGVFSFTQITWFNAGSVFVVMGLISGLVGDIILDLKYVYKQENDIYLNYGMFAFAVGHLFYFVGTVLYSYETINLLLPILISIASAVVLTTVIILVGKKMGLDFGQFLWQSIGYSFLLTFMTVFTIYLSCISLNFIVIAVGMVLFLISDIILSMQYFGGKTEDKFLTIINHATYYSAQILIATFLFMF